ncbi:hypothetical protein CRM22_005056 [Opisthorchis felineus]|uniref:Uncharacterized protein n=1 Tax=Opisthorchis felineus TaxID=147828 RepID=A0A4S2LYQ3_OPIFE|nr:hypothetical protein CRM22_005056 [Opisthorchis felineus]
MKSIGYGSELVKCVDSTAATPFKDDIAFFSLSEQARIARKATARLDGISPTISEALVRVDTGIEFVPPLQNEMFANLSVLSVVQVEKFTFFCLPHDAYCLEQQTDRHSSPSGRYFTGQVEIVILDPEQTFLTK